MAKKEPTFNPNLITAREWVEKHNAVVAASYAVITAAQEFCANNCECPFALCKAVDNLREAKQGAGK